jgi:signal transduction histidine kinase
MIMHDSTASSSGTVLIVEDNPKNIQVLGTILMDAKYRVAVAQKGAAVFGLIPNVKPDLILLDIMMPEMDGYEVCRRLKADPATSAIPVIFLTAKAETDDIVKGFDLGGVDYITKPFRAKELLARVKTQISLVRLQTEVLRLVKLDAERQRLREQQELMRDLHDGLGALSANMGLMAARAAREPDIPAKDRLLEQINQLACELGLEVREVINSLESREFCWGDLAHSLRRNAALVMEAAGLKWELCMAGEIPSKELKYSAGISLLRVMREAMHNVVKHARARSVQMQMEFSHERCLIAVQDDGRGFDPEQTEPAGHGLKNMRDRAREMGGTMQLFASSSGTRLLFALPLSLTGTEGSLNAVNDTRFSS